MRFATVQNGKRQSLLFTLRVDRSLGQALKKVAVMRGETITCLVERSILSELLRIERIAKRKEARS
jgi:hypothetical protein